ncbi:MAG: hypothetical protein A2508_05285 [Candidatus Lambdaproteobacteria bacterium RIFOXYD12_FULL_49_8]|nr:MAG: hypothetical protein A2508_05285 [Candidatus Lambdaproteobacteria bacterium RIFOXYD12_FULL_49_8]
MVIVCYFNGLWKIQFYDKANEADLKSKSPLLRVEISWKSRSLLGLFEGRLTVALLGPPKPFGF